MMAKIRFNAFLDFGFFKVKPSVKMLIFLIHPQFLNDIEIMRVWSNDM